MTDPILRVANHASYPVCIAHDPNWDDQVLVIGGRVGNRTRCLEPGTKTQIGILGGADTARDEHLMGVVFADAKDFESGKVGVRQATIGHHPDTGLLAVTDVHTFGTPSVGYTIANETQWSMDMTFVDS
ncbi:MAG: hypothetical protein ACTHKH_22995 [Trinickia sp.]|jgi:hypothetical protein